MLNPNSLSRVFAPLLLALLSLPAQATSAPPPPECTAYAGTISIDLWAGCLVNGSATVTAVPGGDEVIPPGFELVYLLSGTNGLIIEQVSPSPTFVISSLAIHRIHPLVYDPNTLDLAAFTGGDASVYDIYSLIYNGLCAGLNVSGAPFKVKKCENECTAYAGTIGALQPDLCLTDGEASLEAAPDGNAVVPNGYTVMQLLVHLPDHVILNAGPEPSFTVTSPGEFAILTLVYDPATFDPGSITFGSTTVAALNAQLLQGGGSICASLDPVGAEFAVIDCAPPCQDDAGIGGDRVLCFTDGPVDLFSLLTGTPETGGTWTGPDGQPFPGVFDPATSTQGIYVYFVTDGPDCPGDTTQLVMNVIECGDPCNANAGNDAAIATCTNAPPFSLFPLLGGDAWTGGTWTGPNNTLHSALFIPGVDAPGIYTYSVGDIEPCPGDEAQVTVTVVTAPDAGTSTSITLYINDPPLSLFTALGGTPDVNGTWNPPDGLFDGGSIDPGTYVFTYTVAGIPPCGDASATVTILLLPPPCTAGISAEATVCITDPPFPMLDLLAGEPCPGGEWTAPNGALHGNVFTPGVDPAGIYTYTATNGIGQVSTALLIINVVECVDPCIGAAGEDAQALVCDDGSMVQLFDHLGGTPVAGGYWFSTSLADHVTPDGWFDTMTDQGGLFGYVAQAAPDCPPDTAYVEVIKIQCGGIMQKPSHVGQNDAAQQSVTSGMTDATRIDGLAIWPVPAVDVVHVKLPLRPVGSTNIQVFDATGRLARVPMTIDATNLVLDVRGLTTGTYRIQLTDDSAVYGGRFIRARD